MVMEALVADSTMTTEPAEPAEVRGTEPVETVDLAEHVAQLSAARAGGTELPAGRLLGLPELPGDVWVDIAGASAITGVPPKFSAACRSLMARVRVPAASRAPRWVVSLRSPLGPAVR